MIVQKTQRSFVVVFNKNGKERAANLRKFKIQFMHFEQNKNTFFCPFSFSFHTVVFDKKVFKNILQVGLKEIITTHLRLLYCLLVRHLGQLGWLWQSWKIGQQPVLFVVFQPAVLHPAAWESLPKVWPFCHTLPQLWRSCQCSCCQLPCCQHWSAGTGQIGEVSCRIRLPEPTSWLISRMMWIDLEKRI